MNSLGIAEISGKSVSDIFGEAAKPDLKNIDLVNATAPEVEAEIQNIPLADVSQDIAFDNGM